MTSSAFQWSSREPADFDAGQFVTMQVPGVAGYRGYSMVNFERAAITARFRHQEEARRRRSEWLFNGGAEGADVDVVRAARSGDVLSQPRQEHPVHRRRQRHRRHDVDPLARAAGALFRSVQRLRVLRRAHLRRCVLSRRTAETRARVSRPTARDDRVVGRSGSCRGTLRASRSQRSIMDSCTKSRARHMQGKYQNVRAYLAGPPPSVDASIRMLLLQAKLPADQHPL